MRTIRFYSDAGVVPPADRTEAGYRLYGPDALARLGLVRTLRDLGVDLATIRRVLEREVGLSDVAAAHAAALDAQIRVLRVQKAVLQAVARRGSDPKEFQKMHRLAQLSDDERKRIVADFLDQTFAGLDIEPGFEARMRSAAPELPDDPAPEQVDAWIELAELVQDAGFRAAIRRMSEQHSTARQAGEELRRAGHAGRGRARGGEGERRNWPRAAPRRRRSWPRSSPRSAPAWTATSWPTASRPARTRAPSATGSCWRSSTAGRRSRPPCPAWEWFIAALRA